MGQIISPTSAARPVGSAGSAVLAQIRQRLPTPCLVVDLPAADRNISRAAALVADRTVRLRPHFKAHKCTTLLRRQVAGGGCVGVACQTADEALVLATAGFDDVLVAAPIVDRYALAALARAATQVRLCVVIDCQQHLKLLIETCDEFRVSVDVLIELDVGLGRTGLPFGSPDLPHLARLVTESSALRFRGVQAYEGHVVTRPDGSIRRTLSWQVNAHVRKEIDRLAADGFGCAVVSGGGTGTVDIASHDSVFTEIQAGSYVLLDAAYAALDLPFEPALYCVTTVVSRRDRTAAVLNAGLKHLSTDEGPPRPTDPTLRVLGLSDEHSRVALPADSPLRVGDQLLLIPSHIDPTINMHDAVYVLDAAGNLDRWMIDGRRTLPEPLQPV